MKLPVLDWEWVTSNWLVGQRGSMGSSKQFRLLQSLHISLHRLTARLNCWRQQFTTHWTQRSRAVAYIEPSLLWSKVFGSERYSVHYQRRNINTIPSTKPLLSNSVLITNTIGQWWHKYCVSNQPTSDLNQGPLHVMEPIPADCFYD